MRPEGLRISDDGGLAITGYVVSPFEGVTALFGMLTSCASGVTVVNINNGFGAGYAAMDALTRRIVARIGRRRREQTVAEATQSAT